MKINPIKWSEASPPNEDCRYDHVTGTCPLGTYSIEWKSWKEYDSYCIYFNGDYLAVANDLSYAKMYVDQHYEKTILSCIHSIPSNALSSEDIHDETIIAVVNLARYTYGYKSDEWDRSLRTYTDPDGKFLDRNEVIQAIDEVFAKQRNKK